MQSIHDPKARARKADEGLERQDLMALQDSQA
jgi:hypothetical protein